MSGPKPTRSQGDLAEMLETLLDKGVVINADIAVTIGDTELLSVQIRAAIASFETAARYGLAFPSGTNLDQVAAASGVHPADDEQAVGIDEHIDAADRGGTPADASTDSAQPGDTPDGTEPE